MKEEKLQVRSTFDGYPLDVLLTVPEQEIKGIVVLAHGMCENKERYIGFMHRLSEHGYACCINDHRGHGKSLEKEGDLGWFKDKTGEGIVEDTHQMILMMKERYPHVPLALFGHSMGSLVVRCVARKYDKDIDKLVVCGSPSENPACGIAIALVDILTFFKGERHLSKLMQSMSTGTYDKACPGQKNGWLSTRQEVVDAYNASPLCGFPFTLNGYRNLMILMKNAYRKDGWSLNKKELPILFISGENDPCAVNREQFDSAVQNMKSHGYNNVASKMYGGARHEILNETMYEEVYQDVLNFIA